MKFKKRNFAEISSEEVNYSEDEIQEFDQSRLCRSSFTSNINAQNSVPLNKTTEQQWVDKYKPLTIVKMS
jgi:hypothetical protein